MKKTLLIIACLWASLLSFGEQGTTKWQATVETQKVFIENKGQFDALKVPGKVLYGTDGYTGVFLFTKTGISYRLENYRHRDTDEKEIGKKEKEKEKDRDEDAEHKIALVNVQWEGANSDVQVIAEEELSSYFNYGINHKGVEHARTYKKITYKNLYPNIDVVYVLHPVTGIEYSLVVHPGADLSKVKMRYQGKDKLLLSKGEIHIITGLGDIIDHAPLTYYANDKSKTIASSFALDKKHVSFALGNYDNSQTIIIDPWTTTPTLPTINVAYYIKSDSLGNAYVYGGSSPFTLVKYNPAGNIVWTYSTTWTESNDWFGALAVDRAGNSYITDGDGGSLAKVSPAGNLVWSQTSGSLSLSLEYWSMDFNCDQTQLYIGGMRGPFSAFPVGVWYGVVNQMNLANGTISSYKEVSITPHTGGLSINEVRSLCMSPNGNIYCLSLDTLASLTQSLTMNYRKMHAYNYNYYLPYSDGGTGQGSNNIRATSYFLYTTDGATLDKRDINTGNILTTVTIPGGSAQLNSGVAIDTCGYVYVGSQRSVVKYDANLNQLGIANTPGPVYDVSIGVGGDVLACGSTFAVALAFNACPQVLPICYRIFTANLTPTPPACLGQCSGSATAATTNGTGPYKYLWSNGATTQTIHSLCSGTYLVTVTDLSNNSSAVASTSVDSAGSFITNVVTYPPSCGASNGKAVASIIAGGSSPFTYTWTGGATAQVDSNLAPGTYSVTVTDAHSCTATASATLTQSSSLSVTPVSTPATCSSSNGTASVNITGATGPFQYNWSTGQTTSSISGLTAGTYNVTIQDTTSNSAPFFTENFTNGATGWTLNTPGTGTNGNSANQWVVNNETTCNCTTGNYLHITQSSSSSCLECIIMPAGTCQYLAFPSALGQGNFATDVLAISPVVSTVGKSNITLHFTWESLGTPGADYGLVDLSSDGGAHWTALPFQYDNASNCTSASVSIPSNYQNISSFRFAFEWINAAGTLSSTGNPPGFAIDSITLTAGSSGGCPATASVTVGSSSNFTLTPAATAASCGGNTGSASVSATGSTGYSYHWSNGGNTSTINNVPSGNYTVTVSASGCSATASASVAPGFGIVLSKTAQPTTCGLNNGTANVSVASGAGPFTYTWSNGATTTAITNAAPGSYVVTVSGSGGCTATASAVVDTSASIRLIAYGGRAGCTSSGTASVTVTTGTGPFSYLWSNTATTSSINSLSPGIYSVTVTGAGNCSATALDTVISTGTGITLNQASTASFCRTPTGTAGVVATTGNGPFTYAWSNGQTADTIRNIAGGNYQVTVTGNSGCSASAVIVVPTNGTVTITTTTTNAACGSNNGSSYAVIGGNLLSVYTWSNGATTDTVSGLAPGTYSVTATTMGGCSATANTVVNQTGGAITLPAPAGICQGDTAHICAPPGYSTYHWNTGSTSQCINATQAGNYYVTVTETGTCTATSNHITLTINAPGTITIVQHGDSLIATGASSYQWYLGSTPVSGATGAVYIPTQDGNYSVQATDGNGCKENSNTLVVKTILSITQVDAAGQIKVYPNPLANSNWHLDVSAEWIGANCEVFDAQGKIVFRTEIKNTLSEFELNVAQGVYLMRINSAQKSYTFKLIKL